MNNNWENFLFWTAELGIELNQSQLKKVEDYYQLLLDWNKRINLISRRDVHRIISYHFVDSLACFDFIPANGTVCDLGAGAGLPGIPLKIVCEAIDLYLVESIKKKCQFLSAVIKKLNLERTTVFNQRAETITNLQCDIVIARLLGKLKDILPLGLPLLKIGGRFLIYKSESALEEVNQSKSLLVRFNSQLERVKTITLPGSGVCRRIVSIIKS